MICVPLSALVRDVVQGDVELRNARRDLPRLLMSTRTRDEAVDVAEGRTVSMRMRVKLEVDTTFWSEVAWGVLWRGVVGDLGWKFDVSSCVFLAGSFCLCFVGIEDKSLDRSMSFYV